MKKLILIPFLVLFATICLSQEITTVILVRHAEKIATSDSNPDLTDKGKRRVESLGLLFEAISFNAVYSTDYTRTKNTVTPIADLQNLDIKIYNPRELETFAKSIIENHSGQTILISGHSNTTPKLVNILTGEESFEMLDEKEYDWVFIVDMTELGSAQVKKLKVIVD